MPVKSRWLQGTLGLGFLFVVGFSVRAAATLPAPRILSVTATQTNKPGAKFPTAAMSVTIKWDVPTNDSKVPYRDFGIQACFTATSGGAPVSPSPGNFHLTSGPPFEVTCIESCDAPIQIGLRTRSGTSSEMSAVTTISLTKAQMTCRKQ